MIKAQDTLSIRSDENMLVKVIEVGTSEDSSNMIKAQDTLSMRSGENMLVKVIEVGTSEVKYRKLDNLNGPVFSILKSDLLTIKYENGTKDDFSSVKKIEEYNFSRFDPDFQGKNDAQRYYKGDKTAGTILLISNFIPLVAIPPSLVFYILNSSKIPKDENLNYPSISLMQNEQYANSYRQEAKKIKNQKIWKNFRVGAIIAGSGLLILGIGIGLALAVSTGFM
jgi:hypothetical protein